jgi:hypothetical protein
MGAVYLARHVELDRAVALKILTGDHQRDPAVLVRFQREAEAAMRVSHPGLVKVYDYGHAEGMFYLAMEVVRGRNVAEILHGSGAMTLAAALKITREVLEAIGACHDAGLIHRDLKPGNIIVEDEGGRARVLDLGLAKHVDRTVLTREGSLMGSPRYMPPEMLRGGETGPRADIYQIGLILHECLTGRPVFEERDMGRLLTRILTEAPPPVPGLSGAGSHLIPEFLSRTLAKDPDARFGSCGEALKFLARPGTTHRLEAGPKGPKGPPAASGRLPAAGEAATDPAAAAGPAIRSGALLVATMVVAAAVAFATIGVGLVGRSRRASIGSVGDGSAARTGPVIDSGTGTDAAAPAVGIERGAWDVRWASPLPGRGRVDVRQDQDRSWMTFEEEGRGDRVEHRVRFRFWPAPGSGRRLLYRTRIGDAAPTAERALAPTTAATQVLDLAAQVGATRVELTWNSPSVSTGTVRAGTPDRMVRETVPGQAHRLLVPDLPPGQAVQLHILGPDGRPAATWSGSTVSAATVYELLDRLLAPVDDSLGHIRRVFHDRATGRSAGAEIGRRWKRTLQHWARGEEVRRALALWQQVRGLPPAACGVSAQKRGGILRRLENLIDASLWLEEGSGIDPELPLDALAATVPRAAPPAGLVPVIGLRFGTAPKAPEAPAMIDVPGPALFNADGKFLLKDEVDRSLRLEYKRDLPPGLPVSGRRVFLRYRYAGGSQTEKLAVRCGDGAEDNPFIAFLRGAGAERTAEGVVEVDPRVLTADRPRLKVSHEHRSSRLAAKGMVLEHLIFLAERPRASASLTGTSDAAGTRRARR